MKNNASGMNWKIMKYQTVASHFYQYLYKINFFKETKKPCLQGFSVT